MEWISVKDRLPEKQCDYLCCCCFEHYLSRCIVILEYYTHLEQFQYEGNDMPLRVTHWMPLPNLPEE